MRNPYMKVKKSTNIFFNVQIAKQTNITAASLFQLIEYSLTQKPIDGQYIFEDNGYKIVTVDFEVLYAYFDGIFAIRELHESIFRLHKEKLLSIYLTSPEQWRDIVTHNAKDIKMFVTFYNEEVNELTHNIINKHSIDKNQNEPRLKLVDGVNK